MEFHYFYVIGTKKSENAATVHVCPNGKNEAKRVLKKLQERGVFDSLDITDGVVPKYIREMDVTYENSSSHPDLYKNY
jgi:serine protease inhibitor ecotin